jgi:hypothetical protein
MAKTPSPESKNQTIEPPAPEVLKPQSDDASQETDEAAVSNYEGTPKTGKPLRHRGSYRPSHKATFIGLAVVVLILAVNAGIIAFVLKGQTKTKSQISQEQVILSPSSLDKLGVSRNSVGDLGLELVVGPDAHFNRKVEVGGDVSIAGQLKLNSKFSANDASLTKLEAGDTSLSQLNVNGDATVSTLNLRKDLNVTGLTRLQGVVTVNQLFTINNSANILGNLAVGGTLSVRAFHAGSLITDGDVVIGGHVITQGVAPGVTRGPSAGSNGTVSISGNDTSGTVAVNTGVGAGDGVVANVAFHNRYSNIPHVVVTAIGGTPGNAVWSVYVNRSANGFSIGVNGSLPPGGYAFDYIVEQ